MMPLIQDGATVSTRFNQSPLKSISEQVLPRPEHYSGQAAELKTLTEAYRLGQSKKKKKKLFSIVMTTMEVQRHGDIDWERYKPQILNSSFGRWYNSQLLQLDCAAHTKYTDQVSNGDRNADQTARDEVTGPIYTVIEETTHR